MKASCTQNRSTDYTPSHCCKPFSLLGFVSLHRLSTGYHHPTSIHKQRPLWLKPLFLFCQHVFKTTYPQVFTYYQYYYINQRELLQTRCFFYLYDKKKKNVAQYCDKKKTTHISHTCVKLRLPTSYTRYNYFLFKATINYDFSYKILANFKHFYHSIFPMSSILEFQ